MIIAPVLPIKSFFAGIAFFCAALLTGCQENIPSPKTLFQQFPARDNGKSTFRSLVYCASVPSNWQRLDPHDGESIADTTKANCELHLKEGDQSIRVTLHTFPFGDGAMRISSQAQVERWKRQFDDFDAAASQVLHVSRGGFSGLFFEGVGTIDGSPKKVLAWSMQLAAIYDRSISPTADPKTQVLLADYTIKASGPPELVDKQRLSIEAFAASFELIDELPFSP